MANDYIPADDLGLLAFAQTFSNNLALTWEDLGLTQAEQTQMASTFTAFQTIMNTLAAAKNAATIARQQKDATRQDLVNLIRSYARQLQARTDQSDAQLLAYGLRIRDTTPTRVAAPTSQPVLFVDTSQRLKHSVAFRDALTPLSTAKPAGVLGCEIYRKVGGTAPGDLSECQFLGLDSASPFDVPYGSASGGQTAYYLARWANRNGEVGPTSDLISATVVA